MAGFGHGPSASVERGDPAVAARNARNGLWLFALYFVVYAAFVGLNAFVPDVMGTTFGGINVAIIYGMGLIALALVLALLYCWLCHEPVRPSPQVAGETTGTPAEHGR